jgi:cutinase
MGPIICGKLKKGYAGRVACQGVGGAYTAGLMDNVGAQGTTSGAIKEAAKMFEKAASDCPKAVLVFGGYRLVGLQQS